MQSPLMLPVTLITAGVLAFMATTGILPPSLFRLWPVIFVILGVVGLLSISSEDMLEPASSKKKSSSKRKKSTKSKSSKSKSSKSSKKTTKKTSARKSKSKTSKSKSKKK